MFNSARAVSANERGRRADDEGRDDIAERHYMKAIDLDPKYEPAWFNLGLVFKRRRDWANCLRVNLQAVELDPRPQQPAWWNIGIAATALRDWTTARRAWRGYGISIPDGEGPVDADFGPAPIRHSFTGRARRSGGPTIVRSRRFPGARYPAFDRVRAALATTRRDGKWTADNERSAS